MSKKRLAGPEANQVIDHIPKKKKAGMPLWLMATILLIVLFFMCNGTAVLSNISNTPNTDPSASATRIAELLVYAKQMAEEAKAESLKSVAVQQAPETKAASPPISVDPANTSDYCKNPFPLQEVVDLQKAFRAGGNSAEGATNQAIDICASVCFAHGERNPWASMDCD